MSKKNTILQQATVLFARKGFKETATTDISRMSGVAGATVFYHFSSKEELLLAILEGIKGTIVDRFRQYRRTHRFKNGFDQVQGAVDYYLRLAGDMEDEFLLLHRHFPYQLAEVNGDCRRHLAEIYDCLVDIFEQAIISGRRDGSIGKVPAHKTALILFSTVDGLVRFNTYKLYDAGTLYHELLACCGRILRPEPEMVPELEADRSRT